MTIPLAIISMVTMIFGLGLSLLNSLIQDGKPVGLWAGGLLMGISVATFAALLIISADDKS